MRVFSAVLFTISTAMLLGMAGSSAKADEWNKETIVTFKQPVEIPGHVLSPGTYDFKLEDTLSDRNVVEIWSIDNERLVAIVMAVPIERVETADKSNITFEQLNAQSPKAVKDWFYPGDLTGQQFLYATPPVKTPSPASLK